MSLGEKQAATDRYISFLEEGAVCSLLDPRSVWKRTPEGTSGSLRKLPKVETVLLKSTLSHGFCESKDRRHPSPAGEVHIHSVLTLLRQKRKEHPTRDTRDAKHTKRNTVVVPWSKAATPPSSLEITENHYESLEESQTPEETKDPVEEVLAAVEPKEDDSRKEPPPQPKEPESGDSYEEFVEDRRGIDPSATPPTSPTAKGGHAITPPAPTRPKVPLLLYWAPIKATTNVDLITFQSWVNKNELQKKSKIPWARAACTGDGRIAVPINTVEMVSWIKHQYQADNNWLLLNWTGANSYENMAEMATEVKYTAPLIVLPTLLDAPAESHFEAVFNRCGTAGKPLYSKPVKFGHVTKTTVVFQVYCPFKRNQILRNPICGASMIYPYLPEAGREDPTARIIYNDKRGTLLMTEEVQEQIDQILSRGYRQAQLSQFINPETGVHEQKWLLGFCNSSEATRFAEDAKRWFPTLNSNKEWKLLEGPYKGIQQKQQPNPKKKKEGTRGGSRGRGRGGKGKGGQ